MPVKISDDLKKAILTSGGPGIGPSEVDDLLLRCQVVTRNMLGMVTEEANKQGGPKAQVDSDLMAMTAILLQGENPLVATLHHLNEASAKLAEFQQWLEQNM